MKKLLLSAALLLVAAMLLGTSTFAWFSMNDTVTATGMQVTAKNDSVYLLIAAGDKTAAQVQGGGLISANASTANANVLPSAHDSFGDTATISTIEAASTGSTPTYNKWYYCSATGPSVSTADSTTKTYIPTASVSSYILINEFTITVADGAQDMSNIKVKHCTITTLGDKAVKVIVATSTNSQEFSGEGGDGSTTLCASLTSTTTMKVKVYIYLDGENSKVYTNNVASLKGTSVEITFTGTIGSGE